MFIIDNSLSALLHRTSIHVEMAGYPGPDDQDEDGRQDEGEEGGHRHPVVLSGKQLLNFTVKIKLN